MTPASEATSLNPTLTERSFAPPAFPNDVTYADSTITMDEGSSVKAIILGGKVYTGGWTLDGETLTAHYVQ